MKRKLRDVRGETIVEVLAAILIASLSIGLLFGAVTVSGSIERRTQELDEKSYSDLSGAQMKTAPVIVGSEVTISSGSGQRAERRDAL